ncbi:C1 family peptidase [Mariniplasma anaerobium]|uniref:Aminopeptidase n=1 Tax=Mariniplasma anaerobium TaxID=2735436 RepID=A0A7U9TGZ4_9MOLU|nr:C1 family peptidase [Mariniplasma anaerobium]BCR36325.1 aminopeptidase C [Mariniplasma anaerobium]
MKAITPNDIDKLNNSFSKKPVQKALSRVLVKNNLADLFEKQESSLSNQFKFSNEIKTLPVTNQKQSGRCWIFAGLNLLREVIANKYDLKSFELSQNYTAFWDKFEKINYFIEIMDDFLTVHYDDRTLQHILKTGIQDGGQWDMFVSLIEKYGVVPQEAMVETTSSSGTRFMNQLINVKLRKYAAEARALAQSGKQADIKALKEKTLDDFYTLLVTNFGTPPKTFDFEYVSKDTYKNIKELTPQSFYKEQIGDILKDYVSIINSPTIDKPFMKTYTVSYLGNVIGGRDIKYINLEMKDLKELVIKQMLDNEVVWFGSDVARFGDRTKGVWDDQQFDYEEMLGMSFEMSKENQLYYSQSAMNHAMLLTAVHLDEEVPKRWKIQNSWGDKTGEKGYYMASDSWFDQYVYQAVINKKYLSKEQLKAWEQEPVVLKPWDPMGALAK